MIPSDQIAKMKQFAYDINEKTDAIVMVKIVEGKVEMLTAANTEQRAYIAVALQTFVAEEITGRIKQTPPPDKPRIHSV